MLRSQGPWFGFDVSFTPSPQPQSDFDVGRRIKTEGGRMLSVNPGPLRYIPNGGVLVDRRKPTDRQRRSSAISKVILRTSSELAECRSEEIEQIIQNAIGTVSEIEGAEHAGSYLLAESGT